jgi:peptidyl-prolyl cis-trans isomerase SurA
MFENLKKIFIIFFLVSTINAYAIENKIVVKINEEIITSYDIANEIRYLKILNPSIQSLDNATIEKIAKNSIIREKIKPIENKNNTKNLK